MTKTSFASILGLVAAFAMFSAVPAAAQAQQARDPLTRFIDGLLRRERAEQPAQPVEEPPADPQPAAAKPQKAQAAPKSPVKAASVPLAPAPSLPTPASDEAVPTKQIALSPPLPPRRPTDIPSVPVEVASMPKSPAPIVQAASLSQAAASALPSSPTAALERVNAFFNKLDQMTANFVQESATGQKTEGSLYIKRPGQMRFAYSPPSTLEIVSDGRSVAIRDKKLRTNDVYSVNQTPLKFLVQEHFNLARDTKVQDVQVRPEGIIMVSFEDSATLGGTSKVTLLFDAKANRLKQWVIIDAQGFKTTVVLSDVNVVQRTAEVDTQ